MNGGNYRVANDIITIVADSTERAFVISMATSCEREIEEAQDKHLIDQERRAKVALHQATIVSINGSQ